MQNQNLYPDAAQRILNVVRTAMGDTFTTYFLGLPDGFLPPASAFPLVIVDKVAGTYKVGPTSADDITETVYIHVMVDIKTGLGSPDSDDTVKRQLQTLVEGRDPATGYLQSTSIMGALRRNLTLNSQAVPGIVTINNEISISYAEGHYKNLPTTREALIEITVTSRQMVPARS